MVGGLSRQVAVAGLLLGALALVLRVLLGLDPREAAWCLAPLAILPISAWIRARRSRLSDVGAAVWFDRRAGAGGAVLAAHELADPRWTGRALAASRVELPAWRLRPAALRALGGLLFAAAALLVPVSRAAPELLVSPRVFEAPLEEIEEQLAVLEEHVELDQQRADELRERLEELHEQAQRAPDPEGTFEALDRLAREVADESERAMEHALRAEQSLAAARQSATSAEPHSQEGQEADPDSEASGAEQQASADEMRQHLDEALTELAQAGLSLELPEGLASGLELSNLAGQLPAELDAGQLAQLAEALGEGLTSKLGELIAAGLLDPSQLDGLAGLGVGDLSRYSLHECDESCEEPGGT